jgi:hypothetical protein
MVGEILAGIVGKKAFESVWSMKSKQAKDALPYAKRLAEDEKIQRNLLNAAERLRDAYGRAVRKRGKAAEDKKLYDNVREAATSIRKAAGRAQRKAKPKRRARKLAAVAAAGAAAVLLWTRKGKSHPDLPREEGTESYDGAG